VKVEFYRHQLTENILPEIGKVLDSIFLTTGPVTAEFEERFSGYLGLRKTLGLASCTAGLFLCLKARDIGPGDEVIVPAMTFVATANAVLHTGATPVFADIDPDTGLLDLEDARRKVTPRTKGIIPVHLYGQMVDMEAFRAFADRHGLFLLEDAAHCVEGERNGIKPGQLGDAVCFSFYATKNLTCGEGGAVSTNNDKLAETIRILRLHGLNKDAANRYRHFRHWDMVELGYKYNMNDIQAAMLLPQMDTIDKFHAMREAVFNRYSERIRSTVLPVTLPVTAPGVKHACHLFVIRVDASIRDNLIEHFQEHNVGIAVNYRAVHLNSYYVKNLGTEPGMCPHAERMGDEVISLPFYPSLEADSIEYVTNVMEQFFEKERQ